MQFSTLFPELLIGYDWYFIALYFAK